MSNNLKEKLCKNLKENVTLAPYTTFKIGGTAKYFIEVSDSQQLLDAVKLAEEEKLPYFILAGGSNILVADHGFDGLVIKVNGTSIKVDGTTVTAYAGVNFSKLINETAKIGLCGLERLIGIPGTIGGAVSGNAGAFGCSISDYIEEVEYFKDGKIQKCHSKQCQFDYRQSIFKGQKFVILTVKLKLKQGNKVEIQKTIKETLKERGKVKYTGPNAGSIFKNIIFNQVDKNKVMKGLDINEAEYNKVVKHGKLPVGYVVEALGYNGKKVGGAKILESHGNVIINTGNAKAADVVMLISMIKQKVRNKLGIQLQEEIQMVGF